MSDDPLEGMRQRIQTCRRLAKQILDRQATEALIQMADEIESDLKKLEAEVAARSSSQMPTPTPPVSG